MSFNPVEVEKRAEEVVKKVFETLRITSTKHRSIYNYLKRVIDIAKNNPGQSDYLQKEVLATKLKLQYEVNERLKGKKDKSEEDIDNARENLIKFFLEILNNVPPRNQNEEADLERAELLSKAYYVYGLNYIEKKGKKEVKQ
jgi:hypothetical protein